MAIDSNSLPNIAEPRQRKLENKMLTEIAYDKVFQEVQDFLMDNHPCESTSIVAKFICSTYWGEQGGDYFFDLRTLNLLDQANFENCLLVAQYRRTPKWSDDKFWGLAMFAKVYI